MTPPPVQRCTEPTCVGRVLSPDPLESALRKPSDMVSNGEGGDHLAKVARQCLERFACLELEATPKDPEVGNDCKFALGTWELPQPPSQLAAAMHVVTPSPIKLVVALGLQSTMPQPVV